MKWYDQVAFFGLAAVLFWSTAGQLIVGTVQEYWQ